VLASRRFIENEHDTVISTELDHLGIPGVSGASLAGPFPVRRVALDIDEMREYFFSLPPPLICERVSPIRTGAMNENELLIFGW
jgi:hypothetical protein